ncbi:MAG: hypothetical protein ABEJ26_02910 [Halosimplex sp.]
MDSPRDADRPAVIDADSDRGTRTDRDLRDVLARLVVSEGDRTDDSLRAVARAAGGADRLVPELLGALDDDATAVRIGAAWTLCALADDQPAVVGYLAERLAERCEGDRREPSTRAGSARREPTRERTDGSEPFEVGQVLAYLRGAYPGRVADAIDVAATDGLLDADRGNGSLDADGRGPARSEDARADRAGAAADSPARVEAGPDQGKRIETDGGVPADAVTDLGDGRQVVRPEGRAGGVRQRPVRPERTVRPGESPPQSHPTHPDFEEEDDDGAESEPAAASASEPRETPTPTDPSGPPARPADERPETPETFAAVGALSTFDRVAAVTEGCESRYATGYRCRATREDEERGVATRLFDRPDESDRLAFASDLEDRLARWQALADGERVVDLLEWGDRPRPWAITQPVDESLAERERPPVDEALHQAVDLADAVAHCHGHGAVHAGIDPRNVVFRGDALSGLDRPMLDNVGLMHVFRSYFQPANYLDPRFAAPEYFDDSYGAVDAATDVYGLGATCYYLFTGRSPFSGSYAEVRDGVLNRNPATPSAVHEGVPEALDAVLGKALAKEKIKRYDAVEGFRNDLQAVRGGD